MIRYKGEEKTPTRQLLETRRAVELLYTMAHAVVASVLNERFSMPKKLMRGHFDKWLMAELAKSALRQRPNAAIRTTGSYGMTYVEFSCGLNWPRDHTIRMFLGYDSDMANYQADIFEERDLAHGKAAQHRLDGIIKDLASDWPEEMDAAQAEYDRAVQTAEMILQGVANSQPSQEGRS